jgi:hypothetical protein
MSPQESTIQDTDGNFVPFQQNVNGSTPPSETTQGNLDIQSTLLSTDFEGGFAGATVRSNFKKGYTAPVSPVDVNFSHIHVASSADRSHADMIINHLPDANSPVDQNFTFYYGKVAPTPGIHGREVYDYSIDTNLRVLVYCDTSLYNACDTRPELDPTSEGILGSGGWHLVSGHNSVDGTGEVIELKVSATSGKASISDIGVSPNSHLKFTGGSFSASTLSCPLNSSKRNTTATFQIIPDEWLKYNTDPSKNGLPEFDIKFILEQLNWKGMGETGHVINTEPNHNKKGGFGW